MDKQRISAIDETMKTMEALAAIATKPECKEGDIVFPASTKARNQMATCLGNVIAMPDFEITFKRRPSIDFDLGEVRKRN